MPAKIKFGDNELTPSTVFLQSDMEAYKNAIEEKFVADRTRITAIKDGTKPLKKMLVTVQQQEAGLAVAAIKGRHEAD